MIHWKLMKSKKECIKNFPNCTQTGRKRAFCLRSLGQCVLGVIGLAPGPSGVLRDVGWAGEEVTWDMQPLWTRTSILHLPRCRGVTVWGLGRSQGTVSPDQLLSLGCIPQHSSSVASVPVPPQGSLRIIPKCSWRLWVWVL